MNAPLPLPALDEIRAHQDEMVAIRRQIHANPELACEEHATSDLVAERLQRWGWEVHRGLGDTGVVGTLQAGRSTRRIGLRADMDALPIVETGGRTWTSQVLGKMHACGHDGHTAMLLAAARHLAATRNFDGIVHAVFQPAEEGQAGARRMLQDGFLERFPCEAMFGMHNMPGKPEGKFVASFRPDVRDLLEKRIHEVAQAQAAVYGATAAVHYERRYPVLRNDPVQTAFCQRVVRDWLGDDGLLDVSEPVTGSVDFAFFLEQVPGCYVFIGNGVGSEGGCMVHNPGYDFNDRVLPVGASYWVRLAEAYLAPAA